MTTAPARLARAARLLAALALAVAAALPTRAAQPTAPPIKLPDTPAGKVAAAFLAAAASPTQDSVQGFEETYGSSKRRAATTIPDRVSRLSEMRDRWAPYTVLEVLRTTDAGGGGITLRVGVRSGDPVEMEFQLSPTEPGKLDAVLIASPGPGATPMPITPDARAAAVNAAAQALEDQYVYPELGKRMADAVRAKLAAGEYDTIADDGALASRLTSDFRAVSHDRHIGVQIAPASSADHEDDHIGPTADQMRRRNYGFRKAEVLEGNIGYLAFDIFLDDDDARKTAAAALAFLSSCDAIIFDLRSNGGGSPAMIRFITSYIFSEPTHLNDMLDRDGKLVGESWTLKDVPGPRFRPGLPVYILTARRTFSGAEEFTYNLKNLQRATVVGETTGGGAHPVKPARLNDRLVLRVPYMRAKNPISNSNWEGTGVAPDVDCPADQALERATDLARKAIESKK